MAVDESTIYVADSSNNRIRLLTIGAAAAAVQVSDFAGSGTEGHAEGAGAAARFYRPAGLAVSGTTLYVSEYSGHRIRAIDLSSSTDTVHTIAGSGTAGYKDGTGAAAQFDTPIGLAVSGTTLYVADYKNHRIRAIDLASATNTVRTIAGSGKAESTNGIGTAAQFNRPTGIAVSGDTLYVSTRGKLIRKLEYR